MSDMAKILLIAALAAATRSLPTTRVVCRAVRLTSQEKRSRERSHASG